MPTVTIEGEKSFEVEAGKKLVLAIEDSGYDILHRCGGFARCTTCRVHFLAGEPSEMNAEERATLEEDGLLGQYRLSCQIRVRENLTIDPPDRASVRGIPPGDRPED
ncbi:MAG: (2Fe-2S)-binding protein [Armatimonadota bacterium]|nr:(2Fe-2S)-binding protein [Armatimonadota bacterium]